jgi:hypothetical protein
MGNRLRRQDVYGEALPTKKSMSVRPSDFLIGGMIGLFERKYKKAWLFRNAEEAKAVLGNHVNPLWYGWDALEGFFQNSAGVDASIYVMSHVGYSGAAYDGVAATKNVVDLSAANTFRLDSGYAEELDYSESGNRTGFTIENGARFSTTANGAGIKTDTFVVLTSIAGVIPGDIMKFTATGGGGATVYKKITSVDYSTSKVHFSGAFHGTANIETGDVAIVMGFRLRTWRKSSAGIVSEVDSDLGKIYCTMEPEVSDYYVANVFQTSQWLVVTDLASASGDGLSFPADVATVEYLASGADGTAPTLATHYAQDYAYFDDLPVRFLCLSDTTVVDTNKALETYCKGRWDQPKVIYNIASDRTKAQLIVIGNGYQRGDDVLGVIQEKWYYVEDPFATSAYSPSRAVPSVGHVMGAWVRSIGSLGVHWVPATANTPIRGIKGVVGDEFSDALDRTDLAEAGVNTTIFQIGAGYIIKTFYTPSTAKEFMFANGPLMRDYIMVSVVDSLSPTHNEPNSLRRIEDSSMAIWNFFHRLWDVGSTGSVPEGETFGQWIDDDGEATSIEDHVFVQADAINNPQSSINSGERNLDSWFTYPTPAGSIKIGVGLMLR